MPQLIKINPQLYLIDVNLPDYNVRGAVILGNEQAVVWDTLTHPDDMKEVMSLIGDKPYHVVYTHADWDHIWGTAGLSGHQLSIIGQAHCLERFHDETDVSETLTKMRADEPGRWDAVQLIPPTQTFNATLTLDLGGVILEMIHVPGHTLDCIIGWLPEWGILLGGDVIETPFPVINDESPVKDWLNTLKHWAAIDDIQQAIPAHGTIDGRTCLDRTITYLEKLFSDDDFPIPDEVDEFYQTTHIKNLKLVRNADG